MSLPGGYSIIYPNQKAVGTSHAGGRQKAGAIPTDGQGSAGLEVILKADINKTLLDMMNNKNKAVKMLELI